MLSKVSFFYIFLVNSIIYQLKKKIEMILFLALDDTLQQDNNQR